jgi:hypothetical protein
MIFELRDRLAASGIAAPVVKRCLTDAESAAAALERQRGQLCGGELLLTLVAVATAKARRRG